MMRKWLRTASVSSLDGRCLFRRRSDERCRTGTGTPVFVSRTLGFAVDVRGRLSPLLPRGQTTPSCSTLRNQPEMRPTAPPVLPTADIRWLRRVPKMMTPDWADRLVGSVRAYGPNMQGKLPVMRARAGMFTGHLFLYIRWSVVTPTDFSTGLVFATQEHQYRVLRCNGPHLQPHTNRWPVRRTFTGIPHIHYLTAFFQSKAVAYGTHRYQGDGFAMCTSLYSDSYLDAIQVLGSKVNIQSQGRLFT